MRTRNDGIRSHALHPCRGNEKRGSLSLYISGTAEKIHIIASTPNLRNRVFLAPPPPPFLTRSEASFVRVLFLVHFSATLPTKRVAVGI